MQTRARHFQYTSQIATTLDTITRFHEKPEALCILTPPPLIVQIKDDKRRSLTKGSIDFVLWFGPIPVPWSARHEPGPTPTSFIDRMIKGPMAQWKHEHIFRETDGGVELTDKLTFIHKSGWRGLVSRLMFDGLALRFLFWYRHWRTRLECRKQ